VFLLAAAFVLAAPASAREPSVTISVAIDQAGPVIAPNFSGLSFEASLLLPNTNGVHYYRPDNEPLLNLFHTLGIKSLRLGGNSSDRDANRLPNEGDLDRLFAFAKAARVKVIYCLRLHGGDPQADAAIAKYIVDHYAAQLDCFSIGQEPSAYPVQKSDPRPNSERMGTAHEKYPYSTYAAEWKRFADAIAAAVPDVKFCGPGVHNNGRWARNFIADFGHGHHVTLITEHLYAGGPSGKVPTPDIGRDRMLSDDFVRAYQKLYDGYVPMSLSNGLPYRVEEANNYFNGGVSDVSNTFASALWGLDFMYWWAAHGAAGVNFHSGDKVAVGANLHPSKYTAFFSTTNGYVLRPLGYGIKAFELGSHGRLIPATTSNPDGLNLSTYAVLGGDKNLYLTIINKEHGALARDAIISVRQNKTGSARGQAVFLAVPGSDVAANAGETLGGAEIQADGSWTGTWSPVDFSEVKVPAASAAVVKVSME
jgi:hypothetical protein